MRFPRLRYPHLNWKQGILLALLVVTIGLGVVLAFNSLEKQETAAPAPITDTIASASKKNTPVPAPAPVKSTAPPTPAPAAKPTLPPVIAKPFKFGVGAELDSAMQARITLESPVKILSSWYNGPSDLGFMQNWKTTRIPQSYASGHDLQLVIYAPDGDQTVSTKYGPACGRPYPLSAGFLSDMQQLAAIYGSSARSLYVTMFTELQTYPCSDNEWVGSENYYRALQDQYVAAKDIFHQYAPNSKVALSWGGWQANWNDPGKGGGSALFPYFAAVMNASDFQSFQSMSTTDNLPILTKMTKALHAYGNGAVMVSHYKPDNGSQAVFNADMPAIFTGANMAALQADGLFAFTFMDTVNMNSSEAVFQNTKAVVQTYAHE